MASVRRLLGRWWLILVCAAIGVVMGAADLAVNGSADRALIDFAIVVGYTLILTLLQNRSETASVLAGRPVDERWESINLHALAAAGLVGAFVALGAFVVAEATGRDWSGLAIVAGAIGLAYVGGVIWYRWRL